MAVLKMFNQAVFTFILIICVTKSKSYRLANDRDDSDYGRPTPLRDDDQTFHQNNQRNLNGLSEGGNKPPADYNQYELRKQRQPFGSRTEDDEFVPLNQNDNRNKRAPNVNPQPNCRVLSEQNDNGVSSWICDNVYRTKDGSGPNEGPRGKRHGVRGVREPRYRPYSSRNDDVSLDNYNNGHERRTRNDNNEERCYTTRNEKGENVFICEVPEK